jgi:hypothetical protein
VVVVAVIPIAVFVPPALVLIPPAMMLAPALFARFMQLAPFVVGLLAVTPMMLDRFMQFVLGMLDPALASFVNLTA